MNNIRKAAGITYLVLGVFSTAYYLILLIRGYNLSIQYIWIIIGLAFVTKGIWNLRCGFPKRRCFGILEVITATLLVFFLLTFTLFSAGIIGSMKKEPAKNLDYVIILGAAVRGSEPSETLMARIEAAFNYLVENSDTKAIASGGQGSGEDVSEGECIKQKLMQMGISSDRIIIENESTTTVENLKFSMKLFDGYNSTVGIVTSNFHIFRSKLMLEYYLKHNV